jgi:hypothetical protein
MPMDRFLIAPTNSGLVNNMPPWLIPDDAFEYLQNAYIFRGRIKKRYGSTLSGGVDPLNSRLSISLASGGAAVGITDVSGNAGGVLWTVLGDANDITPAVGMIFSIGTQVYTIISVAAGVQFMKSTMGVATFEASTTDYAFVGAPALTTIYFYPALPVMGITQFEIGKVNNHPTYAFDTRYAYLFAAGFWSRSGTAQWNGNNLNYFWSVNWQGLTGTNFLFVSNFNATLGALAPAATDDPIWYYDGTTWTDAVGVDAFYFRPAGGAVHAGPFVQTARIIVAFKNRLVLLNTVENDNSVGGGEGTATAYTNRARYCFYGSPFAVNAWYEKNQADSSGNVGSGGGYVDASTEEQIISAEFIKDRLIVYFERSTWELVYTNNQVLPFVWQKINTELGSQSTFSTIPFDREVLTIGQSGIHACNGANTTRIDEKIPNTVFEFETANQSTLRTYGIRDYYDEVVYWAYVDDDATQYQIYPNQILLYNYMNGTWAIFDDCATVFGYFEQAPTITWASLEGTQWQTAAWSWRSSTVQPQRRQILYGTPEGFVLIVDSESSRNAPSMQITNMSFVGDGTIILTIISHNLTSSPVITPYDYDFILIENVVADVTTMATLNMNIFDVYSVTNANTIVINTNNRSFAPLTSGTYYGSGTASRVSNIQMKTKQWNPYANNAQDFHLAKIDFAVIRTNSGQITVDYNPSASPISLIGGGVASQSIMGTGILETSPYNPNLYPLEQYQTLLWHPLYFQSTGSFIQLVMSFNQSQMQTPTISLVPFEIQGMCLYTRPTSIRLQ